MLLLVGALKRVASLTLPFLVVTFLFIVIGGILAPFALIGVIYLAATGDPTVNWITIFSAVFMIIYLGL